jgi:hypothetical protein
MGFATDVIEEIAKFSAWVIFDVLMVGTGEIVFVDGNRWPSCASVGSVRVGTPAPNGGFLGA